MHVRNRLKFGSAALGLVLLGLLIAGCSSLGSAKTSITAYTFAAVDNRTLDRDVNAFIDHRTGIITSVVPPGADVSSLVATFLAPEGSSIYVKAASGAKTPQRNGVTANNFTQPVVYLLVLEDGTEAEYVVKIREADTEASLSALALGDGITLSPAFSTGVDNYSTDVPYSIAAIKILPNAKSQYSFITISGRRYGARNAQASVPINAGENEITILVTAEDGVTTESYTLHVTRGEPDRDATLASLRLSEEASLTPEFSSDELNYSAVMTEYMGSIKVAPVTSSAVAAITVNDTAVASGEESAPFDAAEVSEIKIAVIAEDGETIKIYTIRIQRGEPDRDATLASLSLSEEASLTPVFSKNTTSYSVILPYYFSTVTVTPVTNSPVATLTINEETAESGEATEVVVPEEGASTPLTIAVTAQDGETIRTYSLEVVRPAIDATWSQAASATGMQNRYGFASVVFRGRLWAIAGSSTNLDYFNDIWYTEDGENWAKATENPGFSPRRNHQVVVFKSKLWLLGGETGTYEYENDVWTSDDGVYWVKLDVAEPFPKIVSHQAVAYKNKMWIIGGAGPDSTGRSVWSSKNGVSWTEEVHEASFPARDMHQVIVFNGKLWLVGGRRGSERYSDVWQSGDGVTWTLVADSPDTAFGSRMLHRLGVLAGRLWVSGGYVDGFDPANDVWYTRDGKEWHMAADSADFPPRVDHQMITFKGRLWVIGGISRDKSLGDVWFSNASDIAAKPKDSGS
jgi:hypothetical protein